MSLPASNDDHSKIALALIALAAATAMLVLGKITGDAWVSGMTWIVAAYMLGQPAAVLAQGWTARTIASARGQVAATDR